jgi:1-acyl-sn-glycerol-3-phosphate acyltransferase
MDPVIVGLSFQRRLNYLARKSLFRFPPFRWLIEFLDAIPLEHTGLGIGGLKECLRRFKHGEMVLIFPEGTRTRDGSVQAFQPGFLTLARRGAVAVLPVGLDGAFDAWPRDALLPRLARIRVCVGEPFTAEQIKGLDDTQFLRQLEDRVRQCHAAARAARE